LANMKRKVVIDLELSYSPLIRFTHILKYCPLILTRLAKYKINP